MSVNIDNKSINSNSFNQDEKCNKIIKMNSNLFDLDESKKIIDLKEKELKADLERYNEAYLDEKKKSKLCFKLFVLSIILLVVNVRNISNGVYVLPSDIIPRMAFAGLSFAGSITSWLHFTSIADAFLFKKFDIEANLSQIHTYQKDIAEIKSYVNEKLHSHHDEEYLDEINYVLDENIYLNEAISNKYKDKPKTRTLTNKPHKR